MITGFFFMVSVVFGSVTGGILCDKFFQKKFKLVILISLFTGFLSMLIFTLSQPSFFSANPLYRIPEWATCVLVATTGLVLGIAFPVFYELSAELTYPLSESYASGLITLF